MIMYYVMFYSLNYNNNVSPVVDYCMYNYYFIINNKNDIFICCFCELELALTTWESYEFH